MQPVKDASGEGWPTLVFGHDMATNLNAIGYGRINFSDQLQLSDEQMSPERQVLIYCYYIMRQQYCSSRNIYTSYRSWLTSQMESVNGRVQMIDIGCGPATCGIAFSEIFNQVAPNMVYTGVDISTEMKRMGKKLLEDVSERKVYCQFKNSFNELDKQFWDGCSELPSLVLFNFSYFFSKVNQRFTEKLASDIIGVMKTYPLNKYVFIIQHSDDDHSLESFKVFMKILKSVVSFAKQEGKDSLSYFQESMFSGAKIMIIIQLYKFA